MAASPEQPAPEGPPDLALVARVLAGDDRHAFAALVRRHQGPVRALLRRLTRGDEAWADDLAQETFIQAHRKLAQFRGEARFSTWLYRVAYNVFLMAARSRREELPLDELQAPAADDDGPDGPAGEAARSDLQIDLARAIARLSAAERAAITQCYYLDRSHEEAAYVLGAPVGTVKSHISRARQKLRGLLHGWEATR